MLPIIILISIKDPGQLSMLKFKSSDKHNVSNYRHLVKCLPKIFEAITTRKLTAICHPILV